MASRNDILAELHSRFWDVTGIAMVLRNPRRIADELDYPFMAFFAGPDKVESMTNRGGYKLMKRSVPIRAEIFVRATTEESAPEEIETALIAIKTELYRGGSNLGGKAIEIIEDETSELLTTNVELVMGIALDFHIIYTEDIAGLFA